MKKIVLLAGVAVLGLSFISGNQSQAATENLTINAEIVEAIAISCGTALNFGSMEASSGHTVTVDTAGSRSSTVPTQLVSGGGEANGVCSIDGEDGYVVDLNIPDTSVTDGVDIFNVNNYDISGTGVVQTNANNYVITLGVAAAPGDDYNIGGDLVVTAGAGAGSYTGTTTITVTYQ